MTLSAAGKLHLNPSQLIMEMMILGLHNILYLVRHCLDQHALRKNNRKEYQRLFEGDLDRLM